MHALVHPRRAKLFLVDIDRERLSAAIVLRLDERHLEAVGMLRELFGATHAGCTGADDEDSLRGSRFRCHVLKLVNGNRGKSESVARLARSPLFLMRCSPRSRNVTRRRRSQHLPSAVSSLVQLSHASFSSRVPFDSRAHPGAPPNTSICTVGSAGILHEISPSHVQPSSVPRLVPRFLRGSGPCVIPNGSERTTQHRPRLCQPRRQLCHFYD